jgi:hypothetical protein
VPWSGKMSCRLTVAFRLPNAPSLRFYCVYGHGKETEVRVLLAENSRALTEILKFRGHTGERGLIEALLLALA